MIWQLVFCLFIDKYYIIEEVTVDVLVAKIFLLNTSLAIFTFIFVKIVVADLEPDIL